MAKVVDRDQLLERTRARMAYVIPLIAAGLSICVGNSPAPWYLAALTMGLLALVARQRYVTWHLVQAFVFVLLPAAFWASPSNNGVLKFVAILIDLIFLFRGLRETGRGDCWLWRLLSPRAPLPRPWAVAASAKASDKRQRYNREAEASRRFLRGQSQLNLGRRSEATALFVEAYRNGNDILRRRAVEQLTKLDEVETF